MSEILISMHETDGQFLLHWSYLDSGNAIAECCYVRVCVNPISLCFSREDWETGIGFLNSERSMGLISGMFMGIALMAGWREIMSYRGRKRFAKVSYHEFSEEEQLAALEDEKKTLEERKKLKEDGVIRSTMDALDDAVSIVGSGVGLVGTGIGTRVGLVGSGLGTGAGIVSVPLVAALQKLENSWAGLLAGLRELDPPRTPINSIQENGRAKPLQT